MDNIPEIFTLKFIGMLGMVLGIIGIVVSMITALVLVNVYIFVGGMIASGIILSIGITIGNHFNWFN